MAKTTNNRKTAVGRHSAQTGTFEVIHHVQRHPLMRALGGLIRLRAELTTLLTLYVLWRTLDVHVWPGHGTWLLAGMALALLIIPGTRRFVRRRVWCVLTRHRLRQAMVGCRVMTHEGRLPRLLWSRPTSVGERVWLWLRPGLCGHHLERVTDELAAACWAREVRIHVNPRRTVLVRVDVVRYDPLATGGVKSDLTADLTDEGTEGRLIPLPDRAAVRPVQPVSGDGPAAAPSHESIEAPRPRGTTSRSRTRTADTAAPAAEAPVGTGVSGEDVSDYV